MRPDPKELELLIQENPEEALKIIRDLLEDNFDDPQALFYLGYLFLETERFGMAYNAFLRSAQLFPDYAPTWCNMGVCFQHPHIDRALPFFDKALEIKPDDYHALSGKGMAYLELGMPEKCIEYSNKALEIDPDGVGAKSNRGMANLALHNWEQGWKDYEAGAGGKWRRKRSYGVPDWKGEPGTVVIYGEQGLGDEILFASCIHDVQKTNDVIIDTAPRLGGLFKRTFNCPTYETRYSDSTPLVGEQKFDYQISMGALPGMYRNRTEDFPGTPWIKADPERRTQWRALLDTLPGKKVGLAWTGGLRNTNAVGRSFDLSTFKPLFDLDHTFISLEYNQPDEDQLKQYNIKHWPRAVNKGVDYDETMALIAELDLIISVPTTVVHGAGSLGVPCWVLVPSIANFRFHKPGPIPWHNSVKQFRQGKDEDWDVVVKRVKKKLTKEFQHE